MASKYNSPPSARLSTLNVASCAICCLKLPDEPNARLTAWPVSRVKAAAISVNANWRSEAAATFGTGAPRTGNAAVMSMAAIAMAWTHRELLAIVVYRCISRKHAIYRGA